MTSLAQNPAPPRPGLIATARGNVAALALAAMPLLMLPGAGLAQPAAATAKHAQTGPLPAAVVLQRAQDLAIYALGLIGVDYRYGGSSPERGLDCSGLVRYVFQEVVGVTLPRTAREIARLGGRVAPGDLRAGDLVFFNTRNSPFSHVGIYLGDNRFIHAPHRGGEVEIVAMSRRYWQRRYDGARRLVGALPGLIPSARAEQSVASAPAPMDAIADLHR